MTTWEVQGVCHQGKMEVSVSELMDDCRRFVKLLVDDEVR